MKNSTRLILASSNRNKVKEILTFFPELNVLPYTDLIEEFDIVEAGDSFKENALIKAKAIAELFPKDIVISDDSGISVPLLGNEPGIYSARYAGEKATDAQNIAKLTTRLKECNLNETLAFYTAAIAIAKEERFFCVHGFMHGKAITVPRGDKGFGYDPMFIPKGYNLTLGELDSDVKKRLSHRAKGIGLAKKIIDVIL